MQQVRNGLYALEADMPLDPSQITIPCYMLPNTFGKAESEEAAARIIVACQQAGGWYGLDLRVFLDDIMAEQEHTAAQQQARSQVIVEHALRQEARLTAVRRHQWLTRWSGGLYGFFIEEPKPLANLTEDQLPPLEDVFTGLMAHGYAHITTGLALLEESGAVRIERFDRDGERQAVIFPTPKLLAPLGRFVRS